MIALYIILGVAIIALIALLIVFLYVKQRNAASPAPAEKRSGPDSDEIDDLIRQAEKRLASAKMAVGGRVGDLPVFLLLGGSGASKTTAMLHSGLEPELLSGQVFQNGDVIPTGAANVWFSKGALFVEAGGKLASENSRWKRLVRKLQPRSSLVRKGAQAPRAALVFYDCENFTKTGASEEAVAAARNLRARLGEICECMGIDLPVYAVFSKTDRLPFFTEYVRNLSDDEATQVLGITLPLASKDRESVYAEEQAARLSASFERLFSSLADARLELLGRESDPAQSNAAYELPREFRKIRPVVVQFLVDLCRPSQLTTGPFLRGFYFIGARPVTVTEAAPVQPAAPQQVGYRPTAGATGIFQMGTEPQAPRVSAPVTAGARRVPQWVFLSRLFNDIVLGDRVAQAASGASIKKSLARRVLLAGTAALCLGLALAFTISFFRNRRLETDVRDAATLLPPGDSAGVNLAPASALRNLERLRVLAEKLSGYRRDGAPWSYRWGLYVGNDIYPGARRLYFDRFRQLLFGSAQTGMLEALRNLPATPGPDYGPTYETLKAYLMTTAHHEKSTQNFLSPVLMKWWAGSRTVDPERMQLAQKQFDFYADELKEANPFSTEVDGAAVIKSRSYLSLFKGAERVYAFMLAEAAKANPSINFNRQFPGSAATVVDLKDVSGAFAKSGWAFMKDALQHADRYFSGEQWVLGDQAPSQIDGGKLEQDLRARYYTDFINEWRAYFKAANVVRYTDLKDASQKLALLSGNQSPLLELFSMASQNTAVDDPGVSGVFQPVQAVAPPDSKDRFIAPPNQNYMNALVALQASLDALNGQVNDPGATGVLNNATQAKIVTKQMAQTFRPDKDGHLDTVVQKLLEDPITSVEQMLRAAGPAELNAKGKTLCAQFRGVMGKYPFNPASGTDATLEEVGSLFRPPDGALWTFYQQNLQKALTKQGGQYASSGAPPLTPNFVAFFNAAAEFSNALYGGGSDPRFTYSLKPEPTEGVLGTTLRIDGQSLDYSAGAPAASKQFAWQGSGTHEVAATVKLGGPDIKWEDEAGPWSVFRFFSVADQRTLTTLEWVVRVGRNAAIVNGKPLTVKYDLDMGSLPQIFQRGYFSRMSCVAEVAR